MIESLILHNYSLPSEPLILNDLNYPLKRMDTEVDARSAERVRPTEHGIWKGNVFYGKRVWHFEGDILADDSATYIDRRRQLLKVLAPKSHLRPQAATGYMEVQFSGMPVLTTEFSIDGYPEIPVEALSPSATPFQISLKCFDPRLYDAGVTTDMFPNLAVVGRSYNKTYNKTYAPSNSGGSIVASNVGDIETFPIITFHGPSEGPSATMTDADGNNHIFALPDVILGASDVIVADFGERTVTNVNTGANLYFFAQGEWWALEPGDSDVFITAFVSQSGSFASIAWKNAYLI